MEEFLGLPTHPLAVHAPIVLVPLLVLAAAVYALVPRKRGHVAWVAVGLAVLAPVSAVLAKLSGDAFADSRYAQLPASVQEHALQGERMMWSAIALGVLTLALVVVRRGGGESRVRMWAAGALTVLLLVAAGLSGFLIFQVGHSGAEMVWGGG